MSSLSGFLPAVCLRLIRHHPAVLNQNTRRAMVTNPMIRARVMVFFCLSVSFFTFLLSPFRK